MAHYIFTSERLGFRKWEESDKKPFGIMNSDPVVMEYFPKILTKKESDDFVDYMNELIVKQGYGLWAVDILETGEFIGFIGFHHPSFEAPFIPCVEIGWRLHKAFWGNGYATEGAKRCLLYGFNEAGFDTVYSFTSTTNVRSEHVMKKIGLVKEGEFDHPAIDKSHRLCRHVLYKKVR